MHGCIIYELYATLINLSPTAYKEKDKTKKKRRREKGALKLLLLLLSDVVGLAPSS
jgi:hypothetical protein